MNEELSREIDGQWWTLPEDYLKDEDILFYVEDGESE